MVQRAMIGKWRARFFSFVFFILVFEIHGCLSINSEGSALLEFRAKMDLDSLRTLADWSYDYESPCSWSGVQCLDGKVHMLDLHGLDLVGSLALQLATLSHLEVLDLSKNYFSGIVPPEIGQLAALKVLDLSDNSLSGKIPAELDKLHSLKRLLLSGNRFEGNLPLEIQKLSFLTDVEFNGTDGVCYRNRKLSQCIRETVHEISTAGQGAAIAKFLDLFPIFKFQRWSSSPDAQNAEDDQVKAARRVLFERVHNFAALPPSSGIHMAPAPAPSRSSGSFPAVPKKVSPAQAPSPVLSPVNDGPLTTASVQPASPLRPTPERSEISTNLILGISVPLSLLVVAAALLLACRTRAVKTIRPWKTGLSGQLQKAFITGVPKLNRGELETACEDFSNIIIENEGVSTVYKGTLSSGVEIAVASTCVASLKDWSKRSELVFRKKIDAFSRMNHKNFVNLIGFCEEDKPFTRMMVFEYAPNGSLFEHLHVEEREHLDWNTRMRIIMGVGYCLQHMHDQTPSLPLFSLSSKCIFLTDDSAAKIGDLSFWEEFIKKPKNQPESDSEHSELPPLADMETNVYSFGVLLLEVVSGRVPHSEEDGHLLDWASQFINSKHMSKMVDPSLKSFEENELGIICLVSSRCVQPDPLMRPTMKEAVEQLRQEINIAPEQATPSLSPLWWAELEILSSEAA